MLLWLIHQHNLRLSRDTRSEKSAQKGFPIVLMMLERLVTCNPIFKLLYPFVGNADSQLLQLIDKMLTSGQAMYVQANVNRE